MERPKPEVPDTLHTLEKQLYRREDASLGRTRHGFSEPFSKEGVDQLTEQNILSGTMSSAKQPRIAFVYKLFLGSFGFFCIALLVAAYFFLSGSSTFSLDNIDLAVTGPVSIEGGKELQLQVSIVNKTTTELEIADFVVDYPDGSRDPQDTTKLLGPKRERIDVIAPGQVIQKTVRAILFGEENSEKKVKLRLEFQVANSNATFTKEKIYSVTLTSSPVGLSLTVPEQAVSGDQVAMDVVLGSNSDQPVSGVLFSLAYPPGFSFKSSNPAPAFQDSVWQIGDLAPGQKRTIRITGIIEGQNDELKAFRASVGTASDKAEDTLGTVYTSVFKTLSIERPQLGAEFTLGGSNQDVVVSNPGQSLEGKVVIINNLPDQIQDPVITARFAGAVDESTIEPNQGGFYRSSDNEITWDSGGNKDLDSLEPGGSRVLDFSFVSLLPASADFPKGKNPDLTIDVTVTGTRLAPGQGAQKVSTVLKRRVKLSSVVQLSSRLVYTFGPFKNTGPLPPKADDRTTYTAIWSVTNLSSDLSNVSVEATLPQYVEWVGAVSPADENLKFNGGKVVWNIGAIRAGAGITSSAREASFQIAFKPSIAQAGSSPVQVSEATLKGTDTFTQTPVSVTARALTTNLQTDPGFKEGQDRVVK